MSTMGMPPKSNVLITGSPALSAMAVIVSALTALLFWSVSAWRTWALQTPIVF